MSNRVHIFDTTLRDGEQSCGCSMNVPEKMRMARKLVELNVDVMEAGFPMASQGDFDAVDAIGREFKRGHGRGAGPLPHRATSSARPRRWRRPSGRASTPSSPPAPSTSSTS